MDSSILFDFKGLTQKASDKLGDRFSIDYSSPLANLRNGFIQFITVFSTNSKAQQAFATPLLNCNGLAESKSDLLQNLQSDIVTVGMLNNSVVNLDVDDGVLLLSGFQQCATVKDVVSDESYYYLKVTTSSGIIYSFRILKRVFDTSAPVYDTYIEASALNQWWPILTLSLEGAILHSYAPAISSVFDPNDEQDKINDASHLYDIAKSQAASCELNIAISDVSKACLLPNAKDRVNALSSNYESNDSIVSSSARKFLSKCKVLINTSHSGIREVFGYITSMLRITSEADTSQAYLTLTDNMSLVPADFIAGIVSVISNLASTILSVLTLVLKGILRVVAAVVSVTANLIATVVETAKNIDYSTIDAPEADYDRLMDSLPIWPMAPFHGSWDNTSSFSILTQYFEEFGTCLIVDVPGGMMFIGPKEYSGSAVSKWAWEFHPYAYPFMGDEFFENYELLPAFFNFNTARISSYSRDQQVYQADDIAVNLSNIGNPTTDFWNNYCLKYMLDTTSLGSFSGSADVTLDRRLMVGYCICTQVFAMRWAWYNISQSPTYGNYWIRTRYTPYGDAQQEFDFYSYEFYQMIFNEVMCCAPLLMSTRWLNWEHLIKVAGYWVDATQYRFSCCTLVTDQGTPFYYGPYNLWIANDSRYAFYLVSDSNINTRSGCTGMPLPLPYDIRYLCRPPKYSATSFWKWISLAAGITLLTTAVLVTFTVAKNKAFARRRHDNINKTNDARDAYKQASQGVRQKLDDSGNPIYNDDGSPVMEHFDKTSPEGEAYVSSCWKAYRKAVRVANMEQLVIGGTRFDATSFYGDAASDGESAEISNGISSILTTNDSSSMNDDGLVETPNPIIYTLISGREM